MLEKLAEIVREEVTEAGFSVEVPCIACDRRPQGSDACSSDNYCANVETPEGSLMLARWAVLLVAKGLEEEVVDYEIVDKLECLYDADRAAMHIGYRLLDLLEEANPKNKEASVGKEKRGKGEYKCVQRRRTNV